MGSSARVGTSVGSGHEPPDRATINLAQDTRRLLTDGGRETLSAAIRRLIHDSLTLFDLPHPARVVLRREMETLGVKSQRDYVVWLLMERHRQLMSGKGER